MVSERGREVLREFVFMSYFFCTGVRLVTDIHSRIMMFICIKLNCIVLAADCYTTGELFVLLSAPASRTPKASVKFAYQLSNEGKIWVEN
jgi:hypothetical protein